MTPYQRGNRDGLLSLAAELEALAEQAEAEGRRLDAKRHGAGWRPLHRAHDYRIAAGVARRRAEALPDDPEATP